MQQRSVEVGGVRFGLREMMPIDRNAVFATWLPSAREILRDTPERQRAVAWDVFQAEYPALVEELLDHARTVVLFRDEAPNVPHAWACAGRAALHWAYVPFAIRGQGLGRAVIEAALGSYPDRIHVTSPCRASPRFVFNPFALRGAP